MYTQTLEIVNVRLRSWQSARGWWSAIMNASLQRQISAGWLFKPERDTGLFRSDLQMPQKDKNIQQWQKKRSFSLDGIKFTCTSVREDLLWSARPVCSGPECSCWPAATYNLKDSPSFLNICGCFPFSFFENAKIFEVSVKSPILRFACCIKPMYWLVLAPNGVSLKCSPELN